MGGLLNKKEQHVIGPNTKIGYDQNCPICGKFMNKNTTYSEVNKHREQCRNEKDKKQLESLMKDLMKSNRELGYIEKIQEDVKVNKNNSIKIKKNLIGSNSNIPVDNNKLINSNIKKDKYKKTGNFLENKLEDSIKKNGIYKYEKGKSHSVNKKEKNFDLIEFDLDEFSSVSHIPSKKHIKKDSKFDIIFSNMNCNYLKEFPFEEKVTQFKNHIQNLKVDWRESYCTLELNREYLLKESISQFNNIDPYKELHINFKGEISHDAGGIIREWFTVIFKEIQKEELKLFELADTDDFSYKIHKNCQPTIENLDIFNFIGKIIAKALLDNLTLNACFNKIIYKMFLDEEIELDDVVFIDKPLYRSLKELQKSERISDLDLYFVLQYESDGKLVSDELIPDGNNILVTNSNLNEYIRKRIEHIQLKDKIFINEIRSGLFSIIPENLLKIFNSNEIELILNGQPFIDVMDWKMNSIYKGYDEDSYTIQDFWEILSCLTQEELARFLQFCTGSSRVPIGGFAALESNRGNISKFCITKVEWNKMSKNYIRAHTCFNRLDMPEFPNYSMLQEAINFIIQNEILGFGVD